MTASTPPTVSEAMREAVAQFDAREKRLADIVDRYVTDCALVHRTLSEEEVCLLEGLAFGPIASALAALERERDDARTEAERMRRHGAERHRAWDRTNSELFDANKALRAAETELATLRASVERMEAAMKEIRDFPENYDKDGRSWKVGYAFYRVQNIARAALTPKETPDA